MTMRALLIILSSTIVCISGYSQMVLSGTATGACDCYELTNSTNQAGSIWSPSTIDLANPFDFTFDVNLGADDVWGADGMMFVLRQTGTTTGGIGNGMGYSGITNSVGIEIDTWNSSPAVASDIVDDHLGMSSNGTVEHDLEAPLAIANIEDGVYHDFRITWDPVTFDMEVFLDGASMFIYNGDLVTLFFGGTSDVYFGWTGGTGGVDNIQSVCMYRDADFTSDYTTACVDQVITFTDITTSDLIYNSEEAITWDWDFGDGSTSTLENPTHAYTATGTYTVTLTITDISGCSSTETLDIDITAGLDVTMTHTDVTCFGLDDGTGTATPTTGTGPYTYLWDDPLAQTTATSTGLAPNTYNVTVTDDLGCVGTGSITVIEPPELIIDSSVPTNASCGMANGTITITASGGTPALEYSIDGGTTFFPTGNFTGLLNATYDVVVRDANGCTATTTTIVGLDSPLLIDSAVPTDVTCGPVDDGTITITASAGVLPYEYSIDGGLTYQPSNFFDFLSAGTYTVFVRDGAGCEVSTTVTVGSLSTVVIDMVDGTDVTCSGGSDGEISITASGGTPAYVYSIDGGIVFSPTATFTSLSAGSYDIEVMDAAGCVATDMIVLSEPTAITIDLITPTDVSCNGLADGEFELTVSGGTPGYTYSDDAGASFQVSPIFGGLAAGVYDLVIEDAVGCQITGTTTVVEPAVLAIDDILVTDVTCNGLMDGEITVVTSGGTAPNQYRVDGGAYQVSPTFTGLGGGPVTVDVMDANGCMATGDAFLAEADPLVLIMGPDTTICLGGEAVLCPTISGGTAPYTYIWDGVPGAVCLTTSTIGVHSLEVEDVNGCTSELLDQTVNQYVPLSVTSSSATTICPGAEIVIAGEAAGEGPSGYTYEWTNDVDGTTMTGPFHTVTPETTTTYTLTVSSGCENTATTTVTISTFPLPSLGFTADRYEGCQPLPVNFESSADPALVSEIRWEFGDGFTDDGLSPSHVYTDPTCYDVNLRITTVDGCVIDSTYTDPICVWQVPTAEFSYSPTQPDILEPTVYFTNLSEDASSYDWSFGDGSVSSEFEPFRTYPADGNRNYEVELIASTDKGCADTTTQIITIREVVLFYIPNVFTPDGDLFNEDYGPTFIPGFNPLDYQLTIFNRWGELVFESYDWTYRWDGSYGAGGPLVQDGTYVWQITFREEGTDVKHKHYGHVSILR